MFLFLVIGTRYVVISGRITIITYGSKVQIIPVWICERKSDDAREHDSRLILCLSGQVSLFKKKKKTFFAVLLHNIILFAREHGIHLIICN